jgi:hypothetical protein
VGKIAKIAGWTGVLLAYVWVAGVRNIPEAKRRKRRARLKEGLTKYG